LGVPPEHFRRAASPERSGGTPKPRRGSAIAASAAGVDALDTVYTDIADLDGLRRECEDGVAMGFSGKISIHPGQIAVINEAFTPDKALVAEARELVALFEEHRARGAYAFRFKGQMVDAPHLTRARKLIERAGG
jgi:citrate lyase subunit beta/citryl-CoA lyase